MLHHCFLCIRMYEDKTSYFLFPRIYLLFPRKKMANHCSFKSTIIIKKSPYFKCKKCKFRHINDASLQKFCPSWKHALVNEPVSSLFNSRKDWMFTSITKDTKTRSFPANTLSLVGISFAPGCIGHKEAWQLYPK